jgi:hypothetical protein
MEHIRFIHGDRFRPPRRLPGQAMGEAGAIGAGRGGGGWFMVDRAGPMDFGRGRIVEEIRQKTQARMGRRQAWIQ